MAKNPVTGMPGYEADMVMRAITYDSVLMQSDISEYSLFNDLDDSPDEEYRYNNEPETRLLEWLITNRHDGNMRLTREELNIEKQYRFYREIKKPIITDHSIPGDIDLLAIDHKRPHLSVAFQVKRVKARMLENGKAELFIKHIPKAVIQAREMMFKYRFHRNYLMLVIVTDTQYCNKDFQIFRNLPYEEKLCVYEHPALHELPEEVGLYIYELSQPSRNNIHNTGTLAVKEHRNARHLEQPSRTTEAIVEFIKYKNNC